MKIDVGNIAEASGKNIDWQETIQSFIREHLKDNLTVRCQRRKQVRIIETSTAYLRWREKIDILFITSSYDCESIRRIIRSWESYLSRDARIIICNRTGSGLETLIGELTGKLGDFHQAPSVAGSTILSVDPCPHYWDIDYLDIGVCRLCRRVRDFKALRMEYDRVMKRKSLTLGNIESKNDEKH